MFNLQLFATMPKKSLKVRSLSAEEQTALESGRQASQGFTVRRSQIILASAAGHTPSEIARMVGCTRQNVCLVIHGNYSGLKK